MALLAAGGSAAAALASRAEAPIAAVTVTDPVGDASGAGGDIQSVAYTVTDGLLTVVVTYANRSDEGAAPSTQLNITTQDGSATANVAAFAGLPSELSVWQNGAWVEQYQLPTGTWSGHTYTFSIPFSDLQNTLHEPVTPTLQLATLSVEWSSDTATTDDLVPDHGWTVIATEAQKNPAQPPATTTAAPTAPAATTPRLSQAVKRVGGKLEWTRLAVSDVPAGARASVACTRLCRLSEQLRAAHGTAASSRFVRVPFARGSAFVVRVVRASGTGWWWRETVAATASGAAGCIAPGGKLIAGADC